jgi:hypothetical protein
MGGKASVPFFAALHISRRNDSSPSFAMVQPNGFGNFELLARQGPRVKVGLFRASFARNYGARGGLAKSADAQRQAFTRGLKAVLAERLVKQDSWNGADWLWRDDE